MRLFVRAVIDNHRDDPALHQVLFEQAPRPPGLVELLHDAEERIVVAVAELLAADSQVQVSDTDMAARLVVGSVEGLVHRFTASGILGDLGRF